MEKVFEIALRIAVEAHMGQRDKNGMPYILHPLAVASKVDGLELKTIAILHDTIEDTDVTAEYLRSEGFPEDVIRAVLSVTKQEGDNYKDFVCRAAENVIGREVKIADLEDNMDIRRLKTISDDDVERLRKYLGAWQYLNGL